MLLSNKIAYPLTTSTQHPGSGSLHERLGTPPVTNRSTSRAFSLFSLARALFARARRRDGVGVRRRRGLRRRRLAGVRGRLLHRVGVLQVLPVERGARRGKEPVRGGKQGGPLLVGRLSPPPFLCNYRDPNSKHKTAFYYGARTSKWSPARVGDTARRRGRIGCRPALITDRWFLPASLKHSRCDNTLRDAK